MIPQERVLVTGASGLLGPYLVDACTRLGTVTTTSRRSGERPCDLTDSQAVAALLAEVRPTVVVHAAAFTDVDGCENDPDTADSANRACTEHLARQLPDDARLVMVSTDQVYPDSPGPHDEVEVGPVNAYGRTKLAGEQAALAFGALVLRTNFFGPGRSPGRRSLSDFVVDGLLAQKPITLFEDVLFSPLHMRSFAEVLVSAVSAGLRGVFNAACRSGSSKADFGLGVARHLGLSTASVSVGSSSDLPGRAPRPRDLRMRVERLEAALRCEMPALADEIAKL